VARPLVAAVPQQVEVVVRRKAALLDPSLAVRHLEVLLRVAQAPAVTPVRLRVARHPQVAALVARPLVAAVPQQVEVVVRRKADQQGLRALVVPLAARDRGVSPRS
jgi:hypothetical protein